MIIKVQIVGQEDLLLQIKLLTEQMAKLNESLSALLDKPEIKLESTSPFVPSFNVSWSKQ